MTSAEFTAALTRLGLSKRQAAEWLGVNWRTIHRWARGEWPVPKYIAALVKASRKNPTSSAKRKQ